MSRPNAQTPRSSSDLYFVYTRRRTSEGDLITGQWRGVDGWRSGLKGPLTLKEAKRIQALFGCEIIPVEIEDFESLILQAFEKVGTAPPEELIDMDDQLEEEVAAQVEEDEQDDEDKEPDGALEPARDEPEEEGGGEDSLDYPGYHDAISLMQDNDFAWMEAGGGRKKANVEAAWEEFVEQLD